MNLKDDLLGDGPGIETVRKEIERLLQRSASSRAVLVQGETRRGKGLVAWALHRADPRASGTLVLDEIGALLESLQGKLLKVIENRSVRRLGSMLSEPAVRLS